MKKILSFIIIIISIIMMISCNLGKRDNTYEIALITEGTIDDKSFNQGAWEGLKKYADEKSITYKYYQPTQNTTDGYIDSIDLAAASGAKLIITPNYLFEAAIYRAQDNHPDINFVILDGSSQDGTYTDFRIEKNVCSIVYAEEEAGFLAGYAIVKEGYTNLGVMGGMAVPPVVRFSYGFVQGANYAAKEMKLSPGAVKINYTYVGGFNAAPENQTLATSWYQSGVQVIFAPAGGAGNSVMSAAENNNGLVIGVDIDQSFESPTVITSAMKMIKDSVYNVVDSFYNGTFKVGTSTRLDSKANGIGLPMKTSKFKVFNENDYENIYKKLLGGNIEILKDTDVKTVMELPLDIVRVNYIK